MSLTNLSDKEEEQVARPDTPVSSASDDSFHSADNDDSSPVQDGEKRYDFENLFLQIFHVH